MLYRYIKVMLLLVLFALSTVIMGQPDPPGGGHGSNDNEGAGGGAPLGSGVATLVILSLIWGGRKYYKNIKNDLEE